MLFTKDVKVIKSEDKKSYVAYPFDKPNFEARDTDATASYEPKTDGKVTILPDGSEFKGTKLANEVSKGITPEDIELLMTEAVSYAEVASQKERRNKKGEIVANPYTDPVDGSPIEHAGKLFMLACFTESITAHLRLDLDASNREKQVDLAAVRFQLVKNLIKTNKDAVAKNPATKVLTEDAAYLKVAKMEAQDLIDAAEDNGDDLSMADALLEIEWYQERLKPATK